MCFQGFAHHSCGCTKLFEEECDYAKELETAPFYLKVACPNYTIARRYPEFECGKGGLYCANTPDASYLDSVVEFKAKLEAEITSMDKFITEFIQPRRKVVLEALGKQYPGDLPKIKQVYMSHPASADLDLKWTTALQKKANFANRIVGMNYVLRYSRDFYLLQRQQPGYSARNMPPLPDALKNFNFEVARPAPPLHSSSNMVPALAAQPIGIGMGTAIPNGILQSQPVRPQSFPGPDPFGPNPANVKVEQKQLQQPSLPPPPVKEPPRKRGRAPKKAKVVDNAAEDTSSDLRRSTRVRGKKVDYNETSDDYPSATPSPQKSDASTYSPPKSDAKSEVSDPGVKAPRGSSSLRDMIGEYQKQTSAISTPTRHPSISQAGSASSQRLGLLDTVPQIRIDSPRSDTPDTDILQPDDPRHDGGMQVSMQSTTTSSSFAAPAFRTLANGNPDPALLAFQQAYQQTRVSAGTNFTTSQGVASQYGLQASNSPPQRSIGMSPPNLVHYTTPTDPIEPRKRPMAASSPIPSSNKRLELSFPSSYTIPTHNTTSMSSPPKPTYMQRQDSSQGFLSPPKLNSMAPPPSHFRSSSQTFKPSGLSQVSPVQDVFGTTSAATTTTSGDFASGMLPTGSDAFGGNGDVQGNEISELDWALLSDGSKF
ncbi:hypothetical protein PRZ48_009405 [Zasmidium cellare]|uniref:Uncharacterized protein n=1 Tax=Zasmidium cellare TaxID=395010 RepID=A0ABR0EC99_ZASCE|nr:hypothetical protein PRZ48_009405 [Zasmidium cellare]